MLSNWPCSKFCGLILGQLFIKEQIFGLDLYQFGTICRRLHKCNSNDDSCL